ncbi:coproporphyrinogen-III oxidase family protein [Tumebacillus flagellatus]|uniref:Heme chaperone HemW n=1 Tax=Tumebacillus flagellatus TaxID=1157490 RepID=A0A074LQ39_9BACL|nr:coproporphyrinogen-III oxidase family protein [Tumebacillus flagellatus]KEO82590.1 hypothetical protein EL26_14490 [Tumebacillus flagellatus]
MLNLNLNPFPTLLKFDQQLPVYNWYYPFPSDEDDVVDTVDAMRTIPVSKDGYRALYFHIPFCDTLCTFCPFFRSTAYTYHEFIDQYLEALFLEMAWKSQFPGIGNVPVDIIAVGGGTPSVLSAEQIRRFGAKLRENFDLSELKEFTFELEVKSVTQEKLAAMKAIGVNRVSFGIQTFNETFREVFNITSSVEQVRQVAKWAVETFDYVNVDMIYGIAGQSLDDLLEEAEAAMALGTATIDFYPLNNMSASLKMHRSIKEKGLTPLSPATKISYRMFLDEYMRAKGYHPINGYSYTRVQQPPKERQVIVREPVFLYHDMLYGYKGDEVIGFGSSAISQVHQYTMVNPNSMEGFIKAMHEGTLDVTTIQNLDCPEKGIVYFPYRGVLEKSRVDWARVPEETLVALQQAVDQGLVVEDAERYTLSPSGWLFYVNLVYFLTPSKGKQWLSERILLRIEEGREADEVQLYQLT